MNNQTTDDVVTIESIATDVFTEAISTNVLTNVMDEGAATKELVLAEQEKYEKEKRRKKTEKMIIESKSEGELTGYG